MRLNESCVKFWNKYILIVKSVYFEYVCKYFYVYRTEN